MFVVYLQDVIISSPFFGVVTYLPVRQRILRQTLKTAQPALFVNIYGDRLSGNLVGHSVKMMARRAGIARRVSPHTIRHSYATHMLNHGADLLTLMQLMGHMSIQAT